MDHPVSATEEHEDFHQRIQEHVNMHSHSPLEGRINTREHRHQESDRKTTEKQDQIHFHEIVNAFAYYNTYATKHYERAVQNYNSLPKRHQQMLPGMKEKFESWKKCIQANTKFINGVIQDNLLFEDIHGERLQATRASDFNMDKVVSTLRQFCREWGLEGIEERKLSYDLLLGELERVLPVTPETRYSKRVLCPGSGLGRLPFEICQKGYISQGNEWSYFMLITGNYILNKTSHAEQHTIYPFLHQVSNVMKVDDQFRPVNIPDVSPMSLPSNADFSYAAGDFVEIYSKDKDKWDCLVTCFFLDTANNIIEFIETIYHILKPGGWWINLGPLLYHYSFMPHELSIELTLDEVLHVVKEAGFDIKKQEMTETTYTNNARSMMRTIYTAAFWSAQKPK
jgi:carnosine N-methyltransferase